MHRFQENLIIMAVALPCSIKLFIVDLSFTSCTVFIRNFLFDCYLYITMFKFVIVFPIKHRGIDVMGILAKPGSSNHGELSKITIQATKKTIPDKKNYHLSLKGESISRLEWLQNRVSSGTQTEVFSNALQVFEALVKEYESGASFYIKRANNDNIEKFDLFESV